VHVNIEDSGAGWSRYRWHNAGSNGQGTVHTVRDLYKYIYVCTAVHIRNQIDV
jgi:hypothetical protein